MKHILLILLLTLSSLANSDENLTSSNTHKNIWDTHNIWIQTYSNNRNYKIIINNIVKIEQKIKKAKGNSALLDELDSRLSIQKSKLALYDANKSFERLLYPFKFELPEITIREYLFQDTKNKLDKTIDKYIILKNRFYKATYLLKNYYKNTKETKKLVSKTDIAYFEEFAENIDKTYLNLIETKDELNEKYKLYNVEYLQRHITTFIIVTIAYLTYKLFSIILLFIDKKVAQEKNKENYKKILSLFFFSMLFIFLSVRYIEDFLYIITFLGVIAAALTIALREIILNIVGSVYIFFSSMVKVNDRIMVQFETKHTIGDVVDISLMKIKLNEVDDYTNIKEVKNVGRTIFIPNSYVFTKVFYNYSRKKNDFINDLIEFEFLPNSDFAEIEKVTQDIFANLQLHHSITFTLNNLKTGILGLISYKTNYKTASKTRGEISIALLQAYSNHPSISLKSTKKTLKSKEESEE